MFKLEGFVDDKYLAKVMHSLSGLVMNLQVLPVANAASKNGKVVAKTSGDPMELLAKWLHARKDDFVRPADIKQFCIDHGRAANSYSIFVTKAVKLGLLRKAPGSKGNKSIYKVVRK